MKTAIRIASTCCLLFIITSAVAQSDQRGERPAGAQSHGSQGGETRILQQLLQMDDQELANLRQTIERIEKMPQKEKAQLRERIGKIHKMPPEKVNAMRKKFESIPKEEREEMRNRWMQMSAEERTQWRDKLRKMTPEERKAVFEEQGFMPSIPKHGPKGAHSKRPGGKGSQLPRGLKLVPEVEIEEN